MKKYEIIIVGAGPSGLAAAYELYRNGITNILVIDKNSKPGGLARTKIFENNRFDIGPHRFFTKNKEINQLWQEILGNDFLPVARLTRIFYKNKLFNYPLKPLNALTNLGVKESIGSVLSYLKSKISNGKEPKTFEEWVSNQFGSKLFNMFFKTYTEKVWGIDCSKISANWASQRIKGMSLSKAVIDAFIKGGRKKSAKTLVEEFDYPKLGAGMMYERMAEILDENGVDFLFNAEVKDIHINDSKIVDSITIFDKNQKRKVHVDNLFSSIPLTELIKNIKPGVNKKIEESYKKLFFRDHITVNLIIDKDKLFDDQWIYVHSKDVKMGRLANYNNFSSHMPEKDKSAVSVEYFSFVGDKIWKLSNDEIIKLAINELDYMNLISNKMVENGLVIRETQSYPTYFIGYEKYYKPLIDYVKSIKNMSCIGRGGMYKYNNMDHSIYTGLLAARNYIGSDTDFWNVNIDAEYHESATRK